jgi:hypothetical protein
MTMHVAVWAICATLLPWLALTKHPRKMQSPDRPLSILKIERLPFVAKLCGEAGAAFETQEASALFLTTWKGCRS